MEKLERYDLNCNIFDVYDYDGLSMQELLCQFFTKINECVDFSNSTLDLCGWLVNEGLKEEVANKLISWLNDGTLKNVITDSVITDIGYLKKVVEVNVCQFGAKGDGITDDTKAIQDTIDYVKSMGGGVVKFNTGKYVISKPLYISDYIRLIGTGSTTEIYKIKGGKTQLDDNVDYRNVTRESMLLYDACVVSAGGENNYMSIENIHFSTYGNGQKVQWGILTPFIGVSIIRNVTCYDFIEGLRHFMSWNMTMESIRFRRCTYGIRLEMNGTFLGGSTSWNLNRVGTDYCEYGFKLCDLIQSGMSNITVDNNNGRGYWFTRCQGISINGVGYENGNGQIIKLKDSQVVINGFKSLWTKEVNKKPLDMNKNALIEIEGSKHGYGLTLNSGEFFEDTSSLYKFYVSSTSSLITSHITTNSGKLCEELEPTSHGNYNYIGDYYNFSSNPYRVDKYVKLGKIKNHYYDKTFNHYHGYTVYNDVLNESSINRLQIPLSELALNFDFMRVPDVLTWLPIKITIQCGTEGSGNNIWLSPTSIKTVDKLIMDNDIISKIHSDGVNIVIEFNKSVTRPKVVFSLF